MSDDKRISYSTLMKKASTLLKRGNLGGFLECYDKALEFAPDGPLKYWILHVMAKQLESKKRYDEVIKVCNKALGIWSWDGRWRKRKESAIKARDEKKVKRKKTN